jgi:peptide/nickel transport system ATP-binding protein
MVEKMEILKIKDLNVTYTSQSEKVHCLKNISFSVFRGQIISIIGESGSGKSTLGKALSGLLPPSALVSGSMDISHGSHYDFSNRHIEWSEIRGGQIAYIFQDAHQALNPRMTIWQHFKETLSATRMCASIQYQKSCEYLQLLNFSDPKSILASYPFQLSGGMCQRICIALSMSLKPKLLIADEITSALDYESQSEVLKLLEKVRETFGMAILFITHDLKVANKISDDLIIIDEGKQVKTLEKSWPIQGRAIKNIAKDQPFSHPIVDISNVTKRYGNHLVIKGLNLKLHQGEIVGILGESGCGKSTLAKILSGLKAYEEGQVMFLGECFYQHKKRKKRKFYNEVQMVFQDERGCLNAARKIIDIVQEPMNNLELYRRDERKNIAVNYLHRMGIEECHFEKRPPELSTGQCQRVALAKALSVNPKLLILDEFVSALDEKTKFNILDVLFETYKTNNMAIMIISHDVDVLAYICHEIYFMKNGKLSEYNNRGRIDGRKNQESHYRRAYI